jgi:hypothetical protein
VGVTHASLEASVTSGASFLPENGVFGNYANLLKTRLCRSLSVDRVYRLNGLAQNVAGGRSKVSINRVHQRERCPNHVPTITCVNTSRSKNDRIIQ